MIEDMAKSGLFTSKDGVNLCKPRKISATGRSPTDLTFLIIAFMQLSFVLEGEMKIDALDNYDLFAMIRISLTLQVFTDHLLRSK